MVRDKRRSLGSIGDVRNQGSDLSHKSNDDEKEKTTTLARVLTVMAYIISVSTAAALLSAYYVFLWVPQPSDPLPSRRPTDSPFSLAQHGNTHFSGGSSYHYPKNSFSNSMDAAKHMPPSRGSKKSHNYKTTLPPNFLPKPQYLVRKKGTPKPYTTTPHPQSRYH